MGDAENAIQFSKKRTAGRELNRDNPGLDDEEDTEQETGTFKRAPDEVLATRRIVKVRRNQSSSDSSSNPFSGIQLVPATTSTQSKVTTEDQYSDQKILSEDLDGKTDSSKNVEAEAEPKANVEAKNEPQAEIGTEVEAKAEPEDNKQPESKSTEAKAEPAVDDNSKEKDKSNAASGATIPVTDAEPAAAEDKTENVPQSTETRTYNSFQRLSSSQNAFTNLSGTGFSTSTFSFGSIAKDGSTLSSNSGFSLNGNSSLFGTSGTSITSKSEGSGIPSMQEVALETGEENEKSVFTTESALFEYVGGGWKERGKGEVKVNVSTTEAAERARLLMRTRGNYRLILNARLYPDMKLTNMDKKGITFACMNSITEDTNGFSTFALKFKDSSTVEEFRDAVTAHKGNNNYSGLKTPENSPKACVD